MTSTRSAIAARIRLSENTSKPVIASALTFSKQLDSGKVGEALLVPEVSGIDAERVLLLGVGIGLAFAAMANLIVSNVRQDQTGVATGMNTVMRTLGGALGGQIAATFLAGDIVDGLPTDAAYGLAFAMCAVALLVGLAVGFLADVALHEHAAEFLRDGFAAFGLQVGDDHLAAVGREHACRAFTEARSAAGDDEDLACDVHLCAPEPYCNAAKARAVISSTLPVPLMRA